MRCSHIRLTTFHAHHFVWYLHYFSNIAHLSSFIYFLNFIQINKQNSSFTSMTIPQYRFLNKDFDTTIIHTCAFYLLTSFKICLCQILLPTERNHFEYTCVLENCIAKDKCIHLQPHFMVFPIFLPSVIMIIISYNNPFHPGKHLFA